jgi:hypothetical protein
MAVILIAFTVAVVVLLVIFLVGGICIEPLFVFE